MAEIDNSTINKSFVSDTDTPKKFEKVIEDENTINSIPPGYIKIELSTEGKLYAPKVFHMRNFRTEDLMGISLMDDDEVVIRVANMLDDLIWEKDVSVKNFHEREVIETLFILYKTFYNPTMKNMDYKPTDADMEYLATQNGGSDSDAYRNIERDLKSGKWSPKFDINLNSIKMLTPPEKINKSAKIAKTSGFNCVYSMPKYGDAIVLRDYVQQHWAQKDKQFESITKMLKFKYDSEQRWRNGENIQLKSIPEVPESEIKKYNDYVIERNVFSITALRALHLESYRGTDVSEWTMDKKYEIAQDPELDLPTFTKIRTAFDSIKFGIPDKIPIIDPITGKEENYEYSFRIPTILQALGNNESDGTTIEFE